MKKQLLKFLLKTAFLVGIVAAVFTFILSLYRMTGNSMFPSVRDGDLCLFYRLEECHLNDIVLYEDMDGKKKPGRVIAIAGQTVTFPEDGGYEVNGYQPAEEIPYETYQAENSPVNYPLTVPEGSFFILNDYRSDSSDSRQYGVVSETQIIGKLLFLLRRRGF